MSWTEDVSRAAVETLGVRAIVLMGSGSACGRHFRRQALDGQLGRPRSATSWAGDGSVSRPGMTASRWQWQSAAVEASGVAVNVLENVARLEPYILGAYQRGKWKREYVLVTAIGV